MFCPLCQSDAKPAFEIKAFRLLDCTACGHRFAGIDADENHVAAQYDDSYFNGGGAGYDDYFAEAEMLRSRGRMYADKVASFTKPGKILDVGAAAGYILKGFSDKDWIGKGVEPNASMAEFGRSSLGIDLTQGSLESFDTEELFDMVSMIQVAAK